VYERECKKESSLQNKRKFCESCFEPQVIQLDDKSEDYRYELEVNMVEGDEEAVETVGVTDAGRANQSILEQAGKDTKQICGFDGTEIGCHCVKRKER